MELALPNKLCDLKKACHGLTYSPWLLLWVWGGPMAWSMNKFLKAHMHVDKQVLRVLLESWNLSCFEIFKAGT